MTEPTIVFGVAGWSYPDWDGYVFERRIKDKLRFVAGYVDLIEINTTFYQPPSARNSESWLGRIRDLPDFFFTAKLHQEVTHQGLITDAMVRAFHEGLVPLTASGRLRRLLAQFRYDFADQPAARDHLRRIADCFGDVAPLVVEVRHVSWQAPGALEFLDGLDLTVCNLDYPTGRDSFTLQECRVGEDAYFRLHGRNREAWFDKNAGRDETYNYLYSPAELEEIKSRALNIARGRKSLTFVANNHHQGKEVANILQLKHLITGQKLAVPPVLLERYPALAAIVDPAQMPPRPLALFPESK